ncbi:MAG: hypothetical protein QOG37_2320 [Mycobacterium sp.]|jgi:hypothetical protein|nr:hypothetical protein [Mycobacterium sp.]
MLAAYADYCTTGPAKCLENQVEASGAGNPCSPSAT